MYVLLLYDLLAEKHINSDHVQLLLLQLKKINFPSDEKELSLRVVVVVVVVIVAVFSGPVSQLGDPRSR